MADHLGFISSLSFNPDGTRLASVDSIGAIKIWYGLPNEKSASQSIEIKYKILYLFIYLFIDFADSWSLDANLDFTELHVKRYFLINKIYFFLIFIQ